VRSEFRQILISMGFEEMPTSRWVESSFWNFDALFQPQSHPARDAHDTFFVKAPATTMQVTTRPLLLRRPPGGDPGRGVFVVGCRCPRTTIHWFARSTSLEGSVRWDMGTTSSVRKR
jgi:phenylalanyl-tRNA synthetase alpha subunit